MGNRLLFYVSGLDTFNGTGIHRVVKAIYASLVDDPPVGWTPVLAIGDESGSFYEGNFVAASVSEQPLIVRTNRRIEPAEGDLLICVDLAFNISVALRNEISRFRAVGVGVYVVVYDLIPVRHPEWFQGEQQYFNGYSYLDLFRHWLDWALSDTNGIVAISDTVRVDLERWRAEEDDSGKSDRPSLGYFHLGADIRSTPFATAGLPEGYLELLEKIGASNSYLMVGTVEPRKGHSLALDAFDQLWADGCPASLVIVGKPGWKVDALIHRIKSHPQFGQKLHWLDSISDEFLSLIYGASIALLALSEDEGFGLPLVEAAQAQLPIIARDIPVFREVCQQAAYYFEGTSGSDLLECIRRWEVLRHSGEHPRPEAMTILSWAESTKQLLAEIGRMRQINFEWV